MELNKLRHFAVTAKHESLSAAAEKLGLGIPALSRSIKRLEESINGKLFDRTGHGLKLTELGATLLEYAHSIIREHDSAVFAIEAITKRKSGTLRIGVVRYLSNFGLSAAIIEMIRRFPKVGIEVIDSTYEDLILKLLNVEVDVVIAILTTPLSHNELEFQPVVNSDLIIAAGSSHPLAKKDAVSTEDLRGSRNIISNRPAHIRLYYQNLSRVGKQIDQHPLIVSSPALTRSLIYSGKLIAICSRHDVVDDLKSGRIVELKHKVPNNSMPIGFIRRKDGVDSALLMAFLQEAEHSLKEAAQGVA